MFFFWQYHDHLIFEESTFLLKSQYILMGISQTANGVLAFTVYFSLMYGYGNKVYI